MQTYLTQRLATHLSEKTGAKISVGRVDIAFFRRVILEDILVEDQHADTLLFVQSVSAHIDTLKFRQQKLVLKQLTFEGTTFNASRDSLQRFNFSFILDSLERKEKKPNEWLFSCNSFNFLNASVFFHDLHKPEPQVLNINDFEFTISDFFFRKDSAYMKINQLALNDGKEFRINDFNTIFSIAGRKIHLEDFNLKTGFSEVLQSNLFVELPDSSEKFLEAIQFDFQFSHSQISFYDVALLVPSLRGMDQIVDCSGQISGTINDLRGKDLELATGKNTFALMDFYVNEITNHETMYLFLDLKRSRTSFRELSRIKLPGKGKIKFLSFPEELYEAGLVTYRGNFTGFLTDFVAYGTMTSKMGRITTDLSVVPDERRSVTYRGKVATQDFKLGELLDNQMVGNISFNSRVDGIYEIQNKTVSGKFEGTVSKVEFKNYSYENIRLDGILDNKMFDGLVVMNDSNLQFDFLGKVNFNPNVPVFDFRLDLQKGLLGNLNLSDNFPKAELAFLMNANFSGNRIDNLAGLIKVENGTYKNRNGELNLGGMELQSIASGLNNYLTFSSGFFDLEINGSFYAQSIRDAFEKGMYKYLPTVGYNPLEQAKANKFGYQLDVKNLNDLTAVFLPKIKIETPFLLYGQMDSEKSVFELKGSIPGFQTEGVMIRNIFIGNSPRDDVYVSRFRFGEILFKNGMKLDNLTLDSEIAGNSILNTIEWGKEDSKMYSGKILLRSELKQDPVTSHFQIETEGFPSQIFVADSLWEINSFTASIDSSSIKINNLKILGSDQQIILDGLIAENDSSKMMLLLDNISLSNFGPYFEKDLPLQGTLNATAHLMDFYGQRLLYSDIFIGQFIFRDQNVGDISILNLWDKEEQVIKSEMKIVRNERQNLYASGNYNPENRELLYHAEFDNLSLVVMETVIRNNFSNFHGNGTGKLKIHGTPDEILLTGAVEAYNAGLTIDFTQVSYNFTDSVYFKGDTILFDRISLQDLAGNRGTFEGTIVHSNFQDMKYNLAVYSPRLTAMNTTARDNSQFFGQVITNGRLNVTGRGSQVRLSGTGTTLAGTNVNISLDDESELERYDFIQFVSTEDTVRQQFLFPQKDDGDFSLDLTIRATPEARAQLIYNAQIGDIIRAQGEGILRFGMNNDGDITLSGNYTVERGDYLFTLQNVINKRFTIEQGGTITWSGDPYNAILNINAVYKLKASLYDLLVDSYANIYQSQRIPVECKILLTEELSNPNIDFEIAFPTVEDRLVEEVKQYFNTPEEMNKQILSLVVLGKFYTPEYLRGTYEAQNPNLIGTTASELFSNQLSNWLSQISNNVDIGLNYRPGNQITNDEIELALSTQMFNDRVTINGNIGNNNNPNSGNNSQLVGDFDVNVKLIPNGKIRFKAYNRSNNNLIYETSPYTQGVGFTFTEEYNTFNDLLDKMKGIFIRKEEE
ncbi:MAG: translocation/assembly module TamB [Mariniphaga sp.]|nr:translocation/assembly module TamB [Mariniphaga sp.]